MNFLSDTLLPDGTRVVEYAPEGVCSVLIHIEVKKDIIRKVEFTRGCNGNAKGIGSLISGMEMREAVRRLDGITCGSKSTSCPDQLARAMKQMMRTKS